MKKKVNKKLVHKIVENVVKNVINEMQGVAFEQFEGVIDEMIEYIHAYISSNNPNDVQRNDILLNDYSEIKVPHRIFNFSIPQEIIAKLGFVDGLDVKVTIESISVPQWASNKVNLGCLDGSGYNLTQDYNGDESDYENGMNKYNRLTPEGKLEGGEISVEGTVINGNEDFTRIKEILGHELTHAYKNYKTLSNGINADTLNYLNRDNNVESLSNSRNMVSKRAYNIIYRLWNKEEMDAEASTVYTYILEHQLQRENFNKDIQNTHAFREYITFRNNINFLDNFSDPNLFNEIANALNIQMKTPEEFKSFFISKSKKMNQEYLQKMGNCASLAYDKLESNKN